MHFCLRATAASGRPLVLRFRRLPYALTKLDIAKDWYFGYIEEKESVVRKKFPRGLQNGPEHTDCH